jgi:hypothetical protein
MPGQTYAEWLAKLRNAYKPVGARDEADVAFMADAMSRGDYDEALRWRYQVMQRQAARRRKHDADLTVRQALADRIHELARERGITFAEALESVTTAARPK